MKNFTFLLCLMFFFTACQPETDSSETDETSETEQQNDINETTSNTNQGSFSAYDLSSFTCMIEGKEWTPDLAYARVYYSEKNDVDSIQIKGSRVADNSEMTISIFMFKGAGTYELTNDEATGQGIGMAEFKVEEEMKMKTFFSTGGKITITNFSDTNGTIAGTIDEIEFFSKGAGMMPDVREVNGGFFSGQRIEQ
jgi:hypothetical protein